VTPNERITAAAWRAVLNQLNGLPTRPGWCLQAVRVIVEEALGWPSHELYRRFLVAGTSRRPGGPEQRVAAARLDPWAADMEASAKQLGWQVPGVERQAGDLVFNHAVAAPIGHVGVLISRDVVLENIDPAFRPGSVHLGHHSLSLTPYAALPWTLVARVPEPDA